MSIRVSEKLKEKAEQAAEISKRSVGKQIEYWAEIGEVVCGHLSELEVFELLMGDAEVSTMQSFRKDPVGMDTILSNVESRRDRGTMTSSLSRSNVLFESDPERIGGIRMVVDGEITQGDWVDGRFMPMATHASGSAGQS